jgi:hypothetical protein
MKQINFVAGQTGSVAKYDPQARAPVPVSKPRPLTRHQWATLYFTAVRYIGKLFREVGFASVSEERPGILTLELGKFILDMAVKDFSSLPVAHVTSYPGYAYDSEKVNAKVTRMDLCAEGEYLIMVGAVLPNLKSVRPVFVAIDKGSSDPLKEAFVQALMAAKDLISRDPVTLSKIQEAMAGRNLEADFQLFKEMDIANKVEG